MDLKRPVNADHAAAIARDGKTDCKTKDHRDAPRLNVFAIES